MLKQKVVFFLALLIASSASFAETTIYLVRHAEKEISTSRDPSISEKGQQRANMLAQQLKSIKLSHIFSSPYKRTKETAKPLAELLELEVEQYDPRKLQAFAKLLKQIEGNVLVVGHSNTTPQLVDALGGQSEGPIAEHQYDHLYQVIVLEDKVLTNIFRTPLASAKKETAEHQSH